MSQREATLLLDAEFADRPEEESIREQGRLYRATAHELGVEFIGVFEKHLIVMFQDPLTGSSFAIRFGESIDSGIRRVRERFGFK